MAEQILPPPINQNQNPEFLSNTDIAPFPSKGRFYKSGQDSVVFEHMNAKSECILATPAFINSGRILEELLKHQVKDKNLNLDELLTGDINAILLSIRIAAYGNLYPVEVIDPETGEKFEENVDLNRLKFKELEEEPDNELLFNFKLPIRKKTVKFRLLSNKEEKDISFISDNMKKINGGIDTTYIEKLKMQVMDIDGNRDKIYITQFVENMPPLDSLKLKNKINEVEPNLDLSYEFTNPNTGKRFRSIVYLSPRLFYPTA